MKLKIAMLLGAVLLASCSLEEPEFIKVCDKHVTRMHLTLIPQSTGSITTFTQIWIPRQVCIESHQEPNPEYKHAARSE